MTPKLQKNVPDAWGQADAYERYVGRWSRQVAPLFLDWLAAPTGQRWLDVGCGTGTLCAAILHAANPASIVGIDPSPAFLEAARQQLPGSLTLLGADASALPLPDASVDVVVSGLVLNFIPDLPAALAEMARVATAGGLIGAYVWDYAGKMELMRYFWEAAVALDPDAAQRHESARFALCRPDPLMQAFANAGLGNIAVTAIDIPTAFVDFDDYWRPFLGGQGPAPAYAMSLDEAARVQLRENLRARLPAQPDGGIRLTARAWAVRGRKPWSGV